MEGKARKGDGFGDTLQHKEYEGNHDLLCVLQRKLIEEYRRKGLRGSLVISVHEYLLFTNVYII